MKLTNRAKSALATAGYPINEASPMSQLAAFAAQNSGIEFGNYGDRRSYQAEARSISEDWRRFKAALIEAATDGVKDDDIVAAAPHAFSGRLEWVTTTRNDAAGDCPSCGVHRMRDHKPECAGGSHRISGYWNYCTGQYFPTEYRKAAATVLEYAIRSVRQARPAVKGLPTTIAELKALNEKNGGCWFNRSEMRFFGTRIESGIIKGRFFITSETPDENTARKFTIRSFDDEGGIDTVGEFNAHNTKSDAMTALREHVSTLKA